MPFDLVPVDENIRYIRLSEKTMVGAKHNLACEQARGTIIAHWDNDDWHVPHRLSYQVEALLFYDRKTGNAWRYTYSENQRAWLSGSTLCYKRAFWVHHRFAPINVGEDSRFVSKKYDGQQQTTSKQALPSPSSALPVSFGLPLCR